MEKRLSNIIGAGRCVVDLGCGSGHMLDGVAGRFEQRIGLDISRRRLNELAGGDPNGWEFREVDLNESLPLEDGLADVVIANQVIEHVLDPWKFACEIYRVCRPSGRCVITTPNIRYVKNIAHILFSGYGPRTAGGNEMDGSWDDGHVHYFTHRDLREVFAQVGFRSVESSALIALDNAGYLRRTMDQFAAKWPVRELFSGSVLLWADK